MKLQSTVHDKYWYTVVANWSFTGIKRSSEGTRPEDEEEYWFEEETAIDIVDPL